MGSRPEELRTEIERTREELAYDVDRLADRTVPTRVAGRKWEGAKNRVRSVTDRVMGARDTARDKASAVGDKAQEAASRAGDKAQEAAHDVADTVRQTPDTVARQTRGNPLAVGLIAFGVGLLTASLLPETEAEKRAGGAVAERSGDLVDKAKETAREMVDELGGTAREAADQVRETAREAAQHTAEQAKESGRTTVEETRQSVR
jgi:vacuolar-type H+-ATPase subunit H